MNRKLKTTTVIMLLSSLLMTACGTSSNDTGIEALGSDKTLYKSSGFEIAVPNDWEIIESASFTSNIPESTVVAFRNNIKSEIFTANMNIAVSILEEEISSEDFAKNAISNLKTKLSAFSEIKQERKNVKFGTEYESGYLFNFEGKGKSSDPIINFTQLYIVHKNVGHTITMSHIQNEDENIVKVLEEMLNSFSLK